MIALLIGTVAAVLGAEWPRVSARFGSEARQRRERTQRKSQLKLLRTETEEFAASVERDLDQLPTIEETRPEALADDERGPQRPRVGEDARNVFHVLRLLVVGDGEGQRMPAGVRSPRAALAPVPRDTRPARSLRRCAPATTPDRRRSRRRSLPARGSRPRTPRTRADGGVDVAEPEAEAESAGPAACRRVEDDVVAPGTGSSDAGDEAVAPVARAVRILVDTAAPCSRRAGSRRPRGRPAARPRRLDRAT